jgi:hypothetical protein
VLQFLDLPTVSVVCKYWHDICHCEYVEGREAPNSDYLPVPMLSVLPALPALPQLTYDLSSTHHSMPVEIIVPAPGPGPGPSSAKGETQSPCSPVEGQGAVAMNLKEEALSSLSDDNHIGRSSVVLKRQSEIEKFLAELPLPQPQTPSGGEPEAKQIDHTIASEQELEEVKVRLLAVQQMETEKLETKEKIFHWKRHFEKKYRRAPSDEEKVRNIPGLFQRYSIVSPLPLHTSSHLPHS